MPVFYLLVIVAFMLSFLLFSVWFLRYFYIIFCLTFLSLFGVCLCWPVLSYLFCHYSLFNERCSFRHRVLATGIHIHCLSLSFVCIYPFVCLKDISSVPPHFSAFCSLCVRFLSSVFSLFFYNIALICCFSASPWFLSFDYGRNFELSFLFKMPAIFALLFLLDLSLLFDIYK